MRKITMLLAALLGLAWTLQAQNRVKETFDFDWQFHLGDEPRAMEMDFMPQGWEWEEIQLPHDWSIKLPFDEHLSGSDGFLPGGVGLYKKVFTV
ncbi:MAG: beta-glycosidase, partial [Prevotellaceae bacterium]|nr:beta-glycosidase [Prevotellaceae bacterium]